MKNKVIAYTLRNLLLVFAGLVCSTSPAHAQTTTTTAIDGTTPLGVARGTPSGAYALSGFESINLYNGNLNFRLPLLHIGGRGNAQTTMAVALNLKGWHVKHNVFTAPNGDVTESFAPDKTWIGKDVGYGPGVLQGRTSGVGVFRCPTSLNLYVNTLTRLTFTTWDGTEYELRDQSTNGQPKPIPTCAPTGFNRGTIFITADGTAATFISDTAIVDNGTPQGLGGQIYPTGYLFMRDGTRYRIVNGLVNTIRDRNGNTLDFSYDGNSRVVSITDSLNRQVTVQYAVAEAPYGIVDKITYTGFANTARIIRVAKYDHLSNDNLGGNRFRPGAGYGINTYAQLFPELNGSGSTPNDPAVLGAVYLPDGRSYQLYYNPYGELERIVLPTGGAIEYRMVSGSGVYPTVPDAGDYQIYRRVAERLVFKTSTVGSTPEQRTIYSVTASAPSDPRPWTTTVTEDSVDASAGDALMARTTHKFSGSGLASLVAGGVSPGYLYPAWDEGKETRTDALDSNGTTILHRTANTFSQRTSVTWWPAWATQEHLDQSVEPAMDTRLTEASTILNLTNLVSSQVIAYDDFNNKTDVWEYDFGAGTPGPLKRHTVTGYVTSATYTARDGISPHLLSLVSSESIRDGADVERAKTTYNYDVYTPPLADCPNISGHKAGYDTNFLTRGNPTTVTKWLLPSTALATTMSYDIAGNVVTSTDPRQKTTTFDYFPDRFGIPDSEARSNTPPSELAGKSAFAFVTHVTNPLSHESYMQYDYHTGRAVNGEDANGVIAMASYTDPLDRATQLGEAVGTTLERQTSFVYNDAIKTITTTSDQNALGDNALKGEIVYDGLGRTIESRTYEPSGLIHTTSDFDSMGRPHGVTNPYRTTGDATYGTTVTSYDFLSRVKRVETFDGLGASTGAVVTDYMDNQTTVTDQAGKQRRSVTDGLGRLAQVFEDPNGQNLSTTYLYDALDDLAQVTQGSQIRYFIYDSLKRLIRARNPEQNTNPSLALADPLTGNSQWSFKYVYDGDSNLTQRIDPRNITTNYGYDGLNRVISRTYAGDPNGTPAVTYTYDAVGINFSKGRLTQVSSSVSTYDYLQYDQLGRVTQSRQTTDAQSYTMGCAYNLAGAKTSETYPGATGAGNGRLVQTEYDSAGRVAGIKNPATGIYYAGGAAGDSTNRIQYTAFGAPSTIKLGNTLIENTGYNARLQPLQIKLGTAGSPSSVLELDYAYGTTNNNGNVLQQDIHIGSTVMSQTYTYTDSLNRLTGATESVSGVQQWSQTYAYDRFGNRWVTGSSGYTLSPLTPTSSGAFDAATNRLVGVGFYDDAGNQTHDSQGRTFTFDAENSQISFNSTAGQYFYDGDGHRVKKIDNSGTTIFVYNITGQLIAEYTTAAPTGTGTSYLTTDHLGSNRVVTDSSSVVKSRHDYLPFGEELFAGIGPRTTVLGYVADSVRQKFTQKERDNESGLDYFGARYYSSAQARFTTADPIMFNKARLIDPQRVSLYAYVRNNPMAYVDPNGADLRLAKDLNQKGHEKDRKFTVENLARLYMTEKGKSYIERVDKSPIVVEITKGKLERTEINPAKPGEGRFGGQEHVTGGLTTTTTSTDTATGVVTLLAPIVGVQGTENLPVVLVTIDPDNSKDMGLDPVQTAAHELGGHTSNVLDMAERDPSASGIPGMNLNGRDKKAEEEMSVKAQNVGKIPSKASPEAIAKIEEILKARKE